MVVVGIPTLHRYDLLGECLNSLRASSELVAKAIVIDNGGELTTEEGFPWPLEVIRPGRNIGVAASWNLLRRLAGEQDLVLLNDDVRLAADTLGRMIDAPGPLVSVSATPGFEERRSHRSILVFDWSCFLQRKELWDELGPYDETFWPAGEEDNDYWYRMILAGRSVTRLAPKGMTHAAKGSNRELSPRERRSFEIGWSLSRQYYISKWGGPSGSEHFRRPFDGAPLPHVRPIAELAGGLPA